MVKKLIKHEIFAYMRIMVPTYIVLLGIALMGRMIQLFEFDINGVYEVVYDTVFNSSVFIYVIAVIAAITIAAVFAIIRFYKNLFTGEGYLSFSLPVTVSQHIIVKGLVAVIMQFVTLAVAFVSLCVVTFGEVTVEIFKAVGYIWGLGKGNSLFYVLEAVVLFAVATLSEFMLYYLFIAIGQMFNKNRVFAAVGASFVYYLITQVIGTVISIGFGLFGGLIDWGSIVKFIERNAFECAHAFMIIMIVWNIVWCGVYYLITRTILTKRLNLE